jgi:hypothetical protein
MEAGKSQLMHLPRIVIMLYSLSMPLPLFHAPHHTPHSTAGQASSGTRAKLVLAIKAPGENLRELVIRSDGKEITYQVSPGLLGVMLGTLYTSVEPESPTSDKPAAKPAAPSSTEVPPEKKDALPAK